MYGSMWVRMGLGEQKVEEGVNSVTKYRDFYTNPLRSIAYTNNNYSNNNDIHNNR